MHSQRLARFLTAAAGGFLILASALVQPSGAAQAQTLTSGVRITIDSPLAGTNLMNGAQIDIGGWAVDAAAPGTGIDMVRVYIDGTMENGGTLAGSASYGGSRPDVAALLGNAGFANSGFDLLWTPMNLTSGQHTIYVYAHSIQSGWQSTSVAVNATANQPSPAQSGQQFGGPGGPQFGGPGGPGMPPSFLPPPPPPFRQPPPIIPIQPLYYPQVVPTPQAPFVVF